jgi:hypothetical protein
LLGSSSRHGPHTDPHAESTNIGSFIEPDLHKSAVTCQNITELIHRRTPSEPLVHMVENGGRVGLTNLGEERRDLGSQPLRTTHQASPRTMRW